MLSGNIIHDISLYWLDTASRVHKLDVHKLAADESITETEDRLAIAWLYEDSPKIQNVLCSRC